MSENNEQVEKLLGDFFERHTAGDREGMNQVLQKIQTMLYSGEVDSTPFKDYFNSMYTGRSAINVAGMVNDYPRESIIRELLQNVFGVLFALVFCLLFSRMLARFSAPAENS